MLTVTRFIHSFILGWGSVDGWIPGVPYHTLQQVKLPVVETKKCRNTDEDICVGKGFKRLPGGKQQPNACKMDSGGPLMCQRKDGGWQVEGILSFVYTYCKFYSAYVPLNKYLDWVNYVIKN